MTGRCSPGFLAVDADAGTDRRASAASDYGTLRLLELPKDSQVSGPGQVQNDISSSNPTSPDVQPRPVAVPQQRATAGLERDARQPADAARSAVACSTSSRSTCSANTATRRSRCSRATVVAFGDKLAWSDTLDGALDGLFGGNSGASAGDSGSTPTTPDARRRRRHADHAGPADAAALTKALADIQAAYDAGQTALKAGDFAAYGTAQKDLNDAIKRAVAAAPKGGSVTVTPTPSATTTTPAPTGTSTPVTAGSRSHPAPGRFGSGAGRPVRWCLPTRGGAAR